MYPSLVKILFSNIYFIDGIISSELRKHKIYIPFEYFAKNLDLPHEGAIFNPDEQGDNFNYNIVASSFLINPNSLVHTPFTIGFVRPNIRLIDCMVNHMIFPRKSKFSHLTRSDVATVWMIANRIETNWASEVI